jgi:hypothetical protein
VRVSWTPPGGLTQYVLGNAVDISETGIRNSSTEALPVGQYVHLQIESAGLLRYRVGTLMQPNFDPARDRARVFEWRPVETAGDGSPAGWLSPAAP